MMIIFEGEELFLHYHKGDTDYIIITFLGAYETDIAREKFFLKPIVEKYNISCIGITPKIDNYYLHFDMHEIISLCNNITKDYKKIILIGQSVAGYAVLKYSKQLNADIVLALAPRATLDQDICPITNDSAKIASTLTPEKIKETTIKKDDLQGEVFIVYDPLSPPAWLDKEHIGFLKEQVPHVNFVPTYFTEHLVIFHLQGSQVFKSIIDSLATGSVNDIIQTIVYTKRHHIANILTKTHRFKRRYPFLTYKMLTSEAFSKVRNNDQSLKDYQTRLIICYGLNVSGYQQESSDYLKSIFFYHMQNIPYTEQQSISLNPYPYLINYNGYYLGYNFVTKKLKAMLNIGEIAYCLPLQIYKQNGKIKVICYHNNFVFELKYDDDKELFKLALLSNDYTSDHVKLNFMGYNVYIHTKDKKNYVGINTNNASVYYTSTTTKEWEAFTPISMVSPARIII